MPARNGDQYTRTVCCGANAIKRSLNETDLSKFRTPNSESNSPNLCFEKSWVSTFGEVLSKFHFHNRDSVHLKCRYEMKKKKGSRLKRS